MKTWHSLATRLLLNQPDCCAVRQHGVGCARAALRAAVTCLVLIGASSAPGQWHDPLYLPGEDAWHARIPVTVWNDTDHPLMGRPVPIRIGNASGDARLASARAEAIRVCDEQGTEFLFALVQPDGNAVSTGPLPENSQLIIPVECPAQNSRNYFVYF